MTNLSKVYVVNANRGEYSDTDYWTVGVAYTLEGAKALAEEYALAQKNRNPWDIQMALSAEVDWLAEWTNSRDRWDQEQNPEVWYRTTQDEHSWDNITFSITPFTAWEATR